MNETAIPVRFVAGSRKLFAVHRRLHTLAFGLEDLVARRMPPCAGAGPDGLRVLSVSAPLRPELERRFPGYLVGGVQHYRRHYIDMTGTFEAYLARFSGKTRSTFKRKRRKLEEMAGGTLELAEFRTPDEIGRFFEETLPLSRRTYQARLLDAGLPEGEAAMRTARALAGEDRLRAYLLRVQGHAIAYLYLPVEGATLKYAFLGYDPRYAHYSPGTVLQLEALERLFAERRFRYFDFTEGDGAHKAQFGTDSIEACSLLLLRPSLANRLLLASLNGFDGATGWIKQALGGAAMVRVRRMLRL